MEAVKANLSFLEGSFQAKARTEDSLPHRFRDKGEYKLSIKSSLSDPFEGDILLNAYMDYGKTNRGPHPSGVILVVRGVDEFEGKRPLNSGGIMLERTKRCTYFDVDSLGEDNNERIIFVATLPSIKVLGDFLQIIILSN
ncbi:MAG: hypothetical protein F6K39_18225 [Okeania sp. SIO3B3]|nr:hypothetical protein [Okeania sp. SIO3B3]